MPLCVRTDLLIYPFDGAQSVPSRLCEVPTTNPDSPNRFVIPERLVDLLQRFDGCRTTDEVLTEYIADQSPSYSEAKLRQLVDKYFIPNGLLVDSAGECPVRSPREGRRDYLHLKIRIIPRSVVAKVTPFLTWMFTPAAFLGFAGFVVLAHVFFYTQYFAHAQLNINNITGLEVLMLMWIETFFAIIHEFGHATALSAFGSKRAEIGWGLYIVFTVLWTDLSDAWRLDRRRRAIVDAGGIYFHAIALSALCLAMPRFRTPFLIYLFLFIDIQIASQLNPFLRLDGYWIVSDLFGISDLRKQTAKVFERFGLRLLGRSSKEGTLVEVNGTVTRFLSLYCILSVGFFIFLYQFLFRQFIFNLVPAYPSVLIDFFHVLRDEPSKIIVVLTSLTAVIWKGLAIFGFITLLLRFLRRVLTFSARGAKLIRPRTFGAAASN